MPTVSAGEFLRNFGAYQRTAQHEPVAVTDSGRIAGYYVSAEDGELLRRAKASRQAYHPSELPVPLADALRVVEPDPACAALDHLMDD